MTDEKQVTLARWLPALVSTVVVLCGMAANYGMTRQTLIDLERRLDRHTTDKSVHMDFETKVDTFVLRAEWYRDELQEDKDFDEIKAELRRIRELLENR
jgi:hypothetical protein